MFCLYICAWWNQFDESYGGSDNLNEVKIELVCCSLKIGKTNFS